MPATRGNHSTTSRVAHAQAGRLTEWLKLALDEPELLETLGATANLGVLVSGPAGVGKATWCVPCAPTDGWSNSTGPRSARCAPRTGCRPSSSAVATVRDGGGVLLITDIDALLPADTPSRSPR